MPVFRRRQGPVPAARHALRELADPADRDTLVGVLMELDELRATVYRQAGQLRDDELRRGHERAQARELEHRRALIAVRAMRDRAVADPTATDEVRAFAARIAAAVARLDPGPLSAVASVHLPEPRTSQAEAFVGF